MVFPTRHAQAPSHEQMLRGFIWFCLIVSCFVLTRPYGGIFHDNLLYLAQALLRLYPDIFGKDAFFQWGSQDQYSVFSPIYSRLIASFGLNYADIGLMLLAQALFLAASFALVRVLVQPGTRGFAMAFIACSVGFYGGRFIFRMGEPFVTPRPFVEAATLYAIVLLVSGRRGWALAVLTASALLHPLVALAGMAYWWTYCVLEDRRWWWLLALGVIPAGAALGGVAPFTQLFQAFDPAWLEILRTNNPHLFISEWTYKDWGMAGLDVLVLVVGTRFAQGVTRHALQAALAAAVVMLGVASVAADMLNDVLLTNLQPWRALWIVHWMAVATLPYTAMRLWNASAASRLVAVLLVFALITRGSTGSLGASAVALALFCSGDRISITRATERLVQGALALAAFVDWYAVVLRMRNTGFPESPHPTTDFLVHALSKPLPLLLAVAAVVCFGLNSRRALRPAAVTAAAALVLAVLLWDQRSAVSLDLETTPIGSHPFARFVKPHEQVYWDGRLAGPWVMMQRRSFYSGPQQAGQSFNRETAIEFERRRHAIGILQIQESICTMMNDLNRSADACEPDPETIKALCQEAGNLDFIVLQTRVAHKWVASWRWPGGVGARMPAEYLYECKSFL